MAKKITIEEIQRRIDALKVDKSIPTIAKEGALKKLNEALEKQQIFKDMIELDERIMRAKNNNDNSDENKNKLVVKLLDIKLIFLSRLIILDGVNERTHKQSKLDTIIEKIKYSKDRIKAICDHLNDRMELEKYLGLTITSYADAIRPGVELDTSVSNVIDADDELIDELIEKEMNTEKEKVKLRIEQGGEDIVEEWTEKDQKQADQLRETVKTICKTDVTSAPEDDIYETVPEELTNNIKKQLDTVKRTTEEIKGEEFL